MDEWFFMCACLYVCKCACSVCPVRCVNCVYVHYLCQASQLELCHIQSEGHKARGSYRGKSKERGSRLNLSEPGSFLSAGRAQNAFCAECRPGSLPAFHSNSITVPHQPLTAVCHAELSPSLWLTPSLKQLLSTHSGNGPCANIIVAYRFIIFKVTNIGQHFNIFF